MPPPPSPPKILAPPCDDESEQPRVPGAGIKTGMPPWVTPPQTYMSEQTTPLLNTERFFRRPATNTNTPAGQLAGPQCILPVSTGGVLC